MAQRGRGFRRFEVGGRWLDTAQTVQGVAGGNFCIGVESWETIDTDVSARPSQTERLQLARSWPTGWPFGKGHGTRPLDAQRSTVHLHR